MIKVKKVRYSNILVDLSYRVKNCASWFLKPPHCEAKGKNDLQCVFPRGFLKRACGACNFSHVCLHSLTA